VHLFLRFIFCSFSLENHKLEDSAYQVPISVAVLSAKLRGYYNFFGVPGNSRLLRAFHREALRMVLKWLKRRSRKQRLNGWRFYVLLERYRVPEPRIVPYPEGPIP